MMNKLGFLTKISLKKKIASKWFLLANLFIVIGAIALVNVDTIIKYFGGDFNEESEILVIDNTNNYYEDYISKKLDDINLVKTFAFNAFIISTTDASLSSPTFA